MWDKPQALTALANILYGLTAIMLLYATLFLVVNLPIFPLREIRVLGDLQHIRRDEIVFIVRRELRGNFFTLDVDKTRQVFEKLPWVRQVNVRRRWPDRVEVTLEEHIALAKWADKGLVNTQGEVFSAESKTPLPTFIGPKDSEKELVQAYARFNKLLVPLERQVARLELSERRAWHLVLDNQMVIEIGRDKADERLQRFVSNYTHSVAQINRTVQLVDLRYSNGFAVKFDTAPTKPAAKPNAPAAIPKQTKA